MKKLFIIGASLFFMSSCNVTSSKLKKDQIVACLGDSVTYSNKNGYAEYLQQYANEKYSNLNLTFLNWGKNSETITHLSEQNHPGPRPFLFDRLDTLLEQTSRPDIITFCFGMNCGIYGKPSEKLFKTYKTGLNRFLDRMEKEQIKVVLITPTPLVLNTAKLHGNTKLAPLKENYSWLTPYENYDKEVLHKFKDIVLQTKHSAVIDKVNIHTPLTEQQEICYGKDPIHPNAKGNQVIAEKIIKIFF